MTPELVMAILVAAATAAIIVSFAYMLGMYLEGRASRDDSVAPSQDFLVVYLIPCLNEEQVIGATLDRLQPMLNSKSLALVIDDGSDDETATIVASRQGQNVVLLQRKLPEARQGKGAALNAAVHYLLDSPIVDGQPSDQVLVCLLDADGRLGPHAADVAARSFVDRTVGGVQIAVRIGNREEGLLPRLQDMEFVCYTELFQRCRGLAGFAGLGGNGQFTRLSALQALGPEPWSPTTLTEDLDLGIRLVLSGWRTVYRPTAQVHQQGLRSLSALIRQRSRWFQGLLQCWRLIPAVARRSAGRMRLDLLHMLLTPVLILAASLMTLSFLVGPIERVLRTDGEIGFIGLNQVAAWYIMTFLPAFLLARCYQSIAGVSRSRSLALAHAFVLYGLVWAAAGATAVGRLLTGRRSWVKTARLAEASAKSHPASQPRFAGQSEIDWSWERPAAVADGYPVWDHNAAATRGARPSTVDAGRGSNPPDQQVAPARPEARQGQA